jgi:hypothetical protein
MIGPHAIVVSPEPVSVNFPDRFAIAPGVLHVFGITLGNNGCIVVDVAHHSMAQDHSLRVWVSSEPNGDPLPDWQAVWNPNRHPSTEIFAFKDGSGAPARAVAREYDILPGAYFINVLNLVNTENGYIFDLSLV